MDYGVVCTVHCALTTETTRTLAHRTAGYCIDRGSFFFLHVSGKMAVARQGGWATNGAAEGMKMETQEFGWTS